MESNGPDTFDDPALKAAIRRAWSGEQAPPALRSTVRAALSAARESNPIPLHAGRGVASPTRNPLFSLAAAALLLLAIGLVFHRLSSQPAAAPVAALPATFARDLVATHDHCC